jgi:hypothetical protein
MDRALVEAWGEGLTSPQIALLIGQGVTASAVRYRRVILGLKPRGAEVEIFGGKHKACPSPYKPRKPAPVLKLGPESRPKLWAEREGDDCAFPVGQDGEDMVICGGPIPAGARRPYCLHHLALTVTRESAHAA